MLPIEEGQIIGMELTDAEVEPYQTDGFVLRKALAQQLHDPAIGIDQGEAIRSAVLEIRGW